MLLPLQGAPSLCLGKPRALPWAKCSLPLWLSLRPPIFNSGRASIGSKKICMILKQF